MSDSDVDELKAAKEKLTQSAQSVFTKMYEQAAQAQQGAQGAAGPDMNAQAGSNAGSNADDGLSMEISAFHGSSSMLIFDR